MLPFSTASRGSVSRRYLLPPPFKERSFYDNGKTVSYTHLAAGKTEAEAEEALSATRQSLYEKIDSQVSAAVDEQMKTAEIPTVQITEDMITGILSGENLSLPAGSISSEAGASYLVRVGDKINSMEELRSLVLMLSLIHI